MQAAASGVVHEDLLQQLLLLLLLLHRWRRKWMNGLRGDGSWILRELLQRKEGDDGFLWIAWAACWRTANQRWIDMALSDRLENWCAK